MSIPASARPAATAVVDFVAAVDAAAADHSVSLTQLDLVARDKALAQWQVNITGYRQNGWHLVGHRTVAVRAVAPGSDARAWTIASCDDGSQMDLVDHAGKSVRGTAPQRYLVRRDVMQDPSSGSWYVTDEKVEGKC